MPALRQQLRSMPAALVGDYAHATVDQAVVLGQLNLIASATEAATTATHHHRGQA